MGSLIIGSIQTALPTDDSFYRIQDLSGPLEMLEQAQKSFLTLFGFYDQLYPKFSDFLSVVLNFIL
jgi:hypothetical protein